MKQNTGDIVQVSARIPEKEQRDFYSKLAREGTSVSDFFRRHIRRYMEGGENLTESAGQCAPQLPYNEPASTHARWLSLLTDILESGHDAAIRAVTQNLVAFGELVKLARGIPDAAPTLVQPRKDFTGAVEKFDRDAEQLHPNTKNIQKRAGKSTR